MRLENVEAFHQKIGNIVKKELKEFTAAQAEESTLLQRLSHWNCKSNCVEVQSGMPDDLFKRIFDLKETTDKAAEENKYYEKAQLEETIKISGHRLDEIYEKIFLEIATKNQFEIEGVQQSCLRSNQK